MRATPISHSPNQAVFERERKKETGCEAGNLNRLRSMSNALPNSQGELAEWRKSSESMRMSFGEERAKAIELPESVVPR